MIVTIGVLTELHSIVLKAFGGPNFLGYEDLHHKIESQANDHPSFDYSIYNLGIAVAGLLGSPE